jgi:hypothetical protein
MFSNFAVFVVSKYLDILMESSLLALPLINFKTLDIFNKGKNLD